MCCNKNYQISNKAENMIHYQEKKINQQKKIQNESWLDENAKIKKKTFINMFKININYYKYRVGQGNLIRNNSLNSEAK